MRVPTAAALKGGLTFDHYCLIGVRQISGYLSPRIMLCSHGSDVKVTESGLITESDINRSGSDVIRTEREAIFVMFWKDKLILEHMMMSQLGNGCRCNCSLLEVYHIFAHP